MSRIGVFYRSTIGKKAIVAVTGLIMLGFLVAHVAGNLKVFLPDPEPGTADIDAYAAFLRTMGEPLLPHEGALWAMRVALLVALVLHVVCVTQLVLRNRAARPVGYAEFRYRETTLAARWMMISGLLVLAYVVFHILHFTTGDVAPGFEFVYGAVYDNVTGGLAQPVVAGFYIVAMIFLGLHMYHGVWSMLQTLGANNPRYNTLIRRIALLVALIVAVGNISFPVAVLTGMVG